MKSCRSNCLLLFDIFLPLFVLSENLDAEQTQSHWRQIAEDELREALRVRINENVAKNVVLFVGDGLGPNTLTASRIYNGGEGSHLSFEKFPHVALLKTYAVDATVPDSACTATALFTGVKTNSEVSGVDAGVKLDDCQASLKKEHRLSSIADWAQQAGKDTGFVTTTRVTHATPSALYSHTANRKWECDAEIPSSASYCKDIARQLIEDEPGRNFKVIMGGGRQCLTWMIADKPNDPIEAWACKRADGRDLVSDWKLDKVNRAKTYEILSNTEDLRSLDYDNTDYVLGIFANGHMKYEDMRDKSPGGMPSLKEMTSAAIKILQKNKKGYVLMVEGGLIDFSHHRGYARRALEETVEFSEAVAEAVNLTSEDDTLIIVTSDHSHNLNINGKTRSRNDILGIAMNSGVDGVPYTTLTYSTGEKKNYQYEVSKSGKIQRKDPSTYDTRSFNYSQQAGIVSDEATHGGADVALFARGPMSHLFHGLHEQNFVAHVIAYATGIGNYSGRCYAPASCSLPPPEGSTSRSETAGLSAFLVVSLLVVVLDN